MARWMLIEPHYLNVPDTKWEYVETDRATGRPIRKQFDVPIFLHPEDPSNWTEKDIANNGQVIGGRVIVSDGVGAAPTDIIFVGDPTPNMLPLDDHAREVSARFASVWKAPNENSNRTHSQSLLDDLERKMQLVEQQQAKAQQVPMPALEQLLTAVTQMLQQNQEMMKALAIGREQNPTGAYEPPAETATVPPSALPKSSTSAPVRRV